MDFSFADYLIDDGEYHWYAASCDGEIWRVWVDGVEWPPKKRWYLRIWDYLTGAQRTEYPVSSEEVESDEGN